MKTPKRFKNVLLSASLAGMLAVLAPVIATVGIGTAARAEAEAATLSAAPVIYWSHEARRAIVPPGAGAENYGNKFAGDAGVYMGIVHVALYDTALAFEGGYQPYAIELTAPPDASSEAAIATAAHHTLIGLQPGLGLNPAQQTILDTLYANYMAAIPDGTAKTDGVEVGEQVAAAVVTLRTNDGREANPVYGQPPFVPPPSGPGVWDRGNAPALGLLLPGMRPLAMQRASQFRPDGPSAMTSEEYTEDFNQVKEFGSLNSTSRTAEQTTLALFYIDHPSRQWNDTMLALAAARGLDLMQTARMLAMAHVSSGDALIGCWEAKYHYWFWRPPAAIQRAGTDGNPATEPDTTWQPLRATNHPDYPSGHGCNSSAITETLHAFFGTDRVSFTLDSRITNTTIEYERLHDVVKDVNESRVLSGFHFRNSNQEGTNLGRQVSRYVVNNFFQPTR